MDIVINSFGRRAKHYGAVFGAIATLVVATIVPAFASAAELTTRSVALSSAAQSAQNVTYEVKFTAVGAAASFKVLFCSNSPLANDTCTAPTGMSASSAATSTSGYTMGAKTANSFIVASSISASGSVDDTVTGITNPSAAGPVYARIQTYSSADASSGPVDYGSAAISIVQNVNVSASVQETMTFCVSGTNNLTDDTSCASATAPNVKLGQTVGSTVALGTTVSTGNVYTHISTNARTGAIINLKSNATGCGGLLLAGNTSDCNIKPATATSGAAGTPTDGVDDGTATFGVKTSAATFASGGSGTFTQSANYNTTGYRMNYVSGEATGVTSVYGDPFLNTGAAPINNGNMALTFGASASNLTPAGNYSADLSLIATGTF